MIENDVKGSKMVGIRAFSMLLTLLGIKLKLFWDEGTFRVHFRVHLGYIVRVTSTNERKL